METKEQIKKRKTRELKFERVLLYAEWEERGPEEQYINWQQWLKIRKLRKDLEDSKQLKSKSTLQVPILTYTISGTTIKIRKHYYSTDDFTKYCERIEKEFKILNQYDTKVLLLSYKFRNRSCWESTIQFENNSFLCETFKYVLDTREHIPMRKMKIIHVGKKDKNNGRKNPTNRK